MKKKSLIAIISAVIMALLGFGYTLFEGSLSPKDEPAQNSSVSQVQESTANSSEPENEQPSLTSYYIDVGQGDSEFIILPNGKTMLIDAGTREGGEKVISFIQNCGYKKIDYVIGTHPHSDHIGGLADVIKAFDIGTIYMPNKATTTKTYEYLLQTIQNKKKKVKTAKAGVNIAKSKELDFSVDMIAPISEEYEDLNDYSAVIMIRFGDKKFLYMGDAERLVENEILGKNTDVKADVVKVGHHGSSSSSSDKFVKATQAKYAIFSLGAGNDYGHPHKEIVNRWKKYKAEMYRTDEKGTITITSDGKNITVKTEKK